VPYDIERRRLSMPRGTYTTAEEAARNSNWQKAISTSRTVDTQWGPCKVSIAWESRRGYYYIYSGALSHKLPETIKKPTTAEIDAERRWRPW
jgi:hypothetical protein